MYLFTYGTLRPSLYPAALKRFDLKLVGPATLVGPFSMYNLGHYPALIEVPKPAEKIFSTVIGELVEAENLEALDRYEGCNRENPTDPTKGFYYRASKLVRFHYSVERPQAYHEVLATVYFQRPEQVLNPDWSAMYPEVLNNDWGFAIKEGL